MRNLVLAHAMSTEEFDGEHQRLAAELRKPKRVSYDAEAMESVLSWFHGAFMTDHRFDEMDSSELAQDLLVLSADLGPIEPPGLLYRYLWMSPEDARTLRRLNGSHVVKVSVGSKELSSWTGSLDAAKQFRSIGVQDEQPSSLGLEEVIIGAKIPSKNILLSWKALMAFVDAQAEAWRGVAGGDGDDYEEAQRVLKWFGKQDEYVVNTMGGVVGDVDYMDVRDPRGPTYQSTWENQLDKTSAMKPVHTDHALPGGLSVYQALDEMVYWFVGDYMHGYEPLGSPRGLPVLMQAMKDLRRFLKIQSPGQLYRYLWMSPTDAEFLAAHKGKMQVKLSTGDKPLMSWTDDLDTAREFRDIGSKRGVDEDMVQVIVGGKFPASRIALSHEALMGFLDAQMDAWESRSVALDYKGRKGDAGAARNEVHYYNSFKDRIDSYEDQREFVVHTEGGVVDRVNYLETYEGAMSTEDMDPFGWSDEEEGSWETRLDVQKKKSSLAKVATVKHCPGHENSKGEAAPWCIVQEGTGKTLSSHKTESEAREHLKQMEMHKHMASGKTASYWCDAAAGCLCVALSTGRVLLSKRGPDCDEPGTWTTVGGAVDGEETPLEACEREFHEETGYEGEAVFTEVFKDETPEFTYTTFLCFVEDEFDAVSLPEFADENSAFEWFEWGEWPEPLHPKFQDALPDLEPVVEEAVTDLAKAASLGPHPDPLTHMPTNGPQGHHLRPTYTPQNRLLEPDEEQQEKLDHMLMSGVGPAGAQTMQITSADVVTDFSFLTRDGADEPLREFLVSLTNWLSGNYMEKDQDPEELILGLETFVGGDYGDTELFRFCYLTTPEMEAVKAAKASGSKVSVRTARRDLQSWSGSAKGAKHFAHTYYVEQGASPSKPAGAEFVILGASMPGDKILAHMEDVGRWLVSSKDPVLDEKMTPSSYSATWRKKILVQMDEFEGEDEWLVRPGDTPLPVKHLELGEEDATFWDEDEPKDEPYIWKSSMLNKMASWREMDDNDCETVMEWFLGYFMVQSPAQSGMWKATSKLGLSYPDTQLYRHCWVPVKDLQALLEADSVKVRTADISKNYQSWTDDQDIAVNFGKNISNPPREHDTNMDVDEDEQGEDVVTESGYSGVVVGTIMDGERIVLKAQDLRDQLESWYQAHHRGEDSGVVAASPAAIRNLLDTLRTYTEGGRMDQHEYICKPRYVGVEVNYLDWDRSTVGSNPEKFTPPRVDRRTAKVASEATDSVLEALRALPFADELRVFGSVAKGKKDPGDVDVFLDLRDLTWKQFTEHPAFRGLMRVANRYYGSLDPFVLMDEGLLVRNDTANGWMRAKKAKKILADALRDGLPLAQLPAPEDPDAAPKTSGLKTAYVEQELGWLKSYLTMPDASKGDELLRNDPYEFEQFARRTGLVDESVFEDEEWYADDSVLDAIPDPVKVKFLGAYHPEGSDVPLFTIADYEGLVKDQWLVHFTDHPQYIARDGFTKGVALDEWEKLGLSTHFRSRATRPGFNFAYTFQDADEHEGATRYGKECVMFKASGVKIWHHGDQEDQVIFIGATAHDIVPIYRHSDGWYVEGVGPNKEFVTPDLDSMMNWVRDNYDQYRNVLSKKPTRRVIPETKRSSYDVLSIGGSPVKLYHMTNAEFDTFQHPEWKDTDLEAYFFSSDPGYWESVGASRRKNTIPVNLSLKNPAYLSQKDIDGLGYKKDFITKLKSEGHDGAIGPDMLEVVVFKPGQIHRLDRGKTASLDPHEAAVHMRTMSKWLVGHYVEWTEEVGEVSEAIEFFRPYLDIEVPDTLYRMMFLSEEDVSSIRNHKGGVSVKTGVNKPMSSWTPSLQHAQDFYEASTNMTSGDDRPEVAVVLAAQLPPGRVVWQKSAFVALLESLAPTATGQSATDLQNCLNIMSDEGLDVGDEFLLLGDPERVEGLYTLRGETLWDDEWVKDKWAKRAAKDLPKGFSDWWGSTDFEKWLEDQGGIKQLMDTSMDSYYEWAGEELGNDRFEDDPAHLKAVEDLALDLAHDGLIDKFNHWMYKYQHLLNFPLKLYRAVSINGLEDLKTDGVGVYWSDDPRCAVAHWGTPGVATWVLEAECDEDSVDWPGTLAANMDPGLGEDEQEIRLKPGARLRLLQMYKKGEKSTGVTKNEEVTAKVAAEEEPNERIQFMQFLRRWYDGTYMGKQEVPELLRKGLRDNVPPSPPKELHRFCYLDRDDVQDLKANNGNVKLRSAARPLQSWAESLGAVEVFARDAVGGDSEFPPRPGEAVFVIISAQIPTSAILATPETLKAWVESCDWPEMGQPWQPSGPKTWRESLASLLVLYKEEEECIVDLSDSVVEVTGLRVGHELMTEDYDDDGDEYERPEYPYWVWKDASKRAWGKKPEPPLDGGDLSVLDLWVQGSYTHHQGNVGQHLQAIKSKLGLSYGPVTLYRACWLPEDQAKPMDGASALVDASHAGEYQSWTGSPDKAREFHDRFLGDPKPGFSKVILQAQMSGPEVVFRFSDVQKAISGMPLSRELTDALQACKGAAAFDEYVCHLPGPVRASVSVPKRAEWKRSPITVPQVYQDRRDLVAPKTGSIAWQPTPTIEVRPGQWIAPVSKKGTYFTKQNFPKQQALVTPRPGSPGLWFVRIGSVTELWRSLKNEDFGPLFEGVTDGSHAGRTPGRSR